MNKTELAGIIASEPQQRLTNSGIEVTSFLLSVKDLRNYEMSYLIPITGYGSSASYINKFCHKGSYLIIDGRLTRTSYINKNNETIYNTQVVIDHVKSLRFSQDQNNDPLSRMNQTNQPIDLDDVFGKQNEAKNDDWEEELIS